MAERITPSNFLLPHEVKIAEGKKALIGGERAYAVSEVKKAFVACGDWAENGPVEAAQGAAQLAANRVQQFSDALDTFDQVGYPDPADLSVQPGSYVRVDSMGERLGWMLGGKKTLYYGIELPSDREVEEVTVITPANSTLWQALIGRVCGDVFAYTTDNGRDFSGQILAVDQHLVADTFASYLVSKTVTSEAVPNGPTIVAADI